MLHALPYGENGSRAIGIPAKERILYCVLKVARLRAVSAGIASYQRMGFLPQGFFKTGKD
jgi:hypothetical protein